MQLLQQAIEYFQFLVNLNGTKPKKAKEILDKWWEERDYKSAPSEFNRWYYQNYPEHNGNNHK